MAEQNRKVKKKKKRQGEKEMQKKEEKKHTHTQIPDLVSVETSKTELKMLEKRDVSSSSICIPKCKPEEIMQKRCSYPVWYEGGDTTYFVLNFGGDCIETDWRFRKLIPKPGLVGVERF